ncbi:penicillin-binding protein 1C [Azospirillaceae bacterium]
MTQRRAIKVTFSSVLLFTAIFILDQCFPPPLDRLRDVSTLVSDRNGAPLRLFANSEGRWRLPISIAEVSPLYRDLLLATEDRRFFSHPGIDILAIGRAALQNLRAGRIASGASTLTMQTARLLEPHRRSWPSKFLELFRALQLELRYDKQTLLEMYMTLAPFGGPVDGIKAAALFLFDKSPARLAPAEAALLAALPQAPSRLRPDRAPKAAQAARDRALARAVEADLLSPQAAREAAEEPVPTHRRATPFSAAHLADRLRRQRPGQTIIRTTIDAPLQHAIEALARQDIQTLNERAGLAILVVDHHVRAVRAAIGAPEPLNETRNGPIDMTMALRSPGSTLKPFVYGVAFDDRIIHPETLIADVSTRFGSYSPGNFDKGFHGELTAREALQQSLNVPAVIVFDRVGPTRFVDALRRAGVRLAFPPDTAPGLPIVLGGVSTTLWDMTMLYTGLRREGRVAPLLTNADEAEKALQIENAAEALTGVRVLSPDAAWQVTRILEGAPPPPGLIQAVEATQRPPIALKTGTSYGFRDAWSFGSTTRYTVGVWVGRPDGVPSPDRYGRNTAAPLLYKIFDLLPTESMAGSLEQIRRKTPFRPPIESIALPQSLRRLEAGNPLAHPIALPDPNRLRLVFPSPGMTIDALQPDGAITSVILVANGGKRPLTWFIDGSPVPSLSTRRETEWTPDGPGFAKITVIDADGRSAAAEVQIR